jgi:hypothetical protein
MRLTEIEADREDRARRYPCPTCGARAMPRTARDAEPYACWAPITRTGHRRRTYAAHTSRYNLAAADGLVPEMAGAR